MPLIWLYQVLPHNKKDLHHLIMHSDPGLRYWGAIGLLRLGDYSSAEYLSNDVSDEVKAIGAWMLIAMRDMKMVSIFSLVC